MDNQDIAGGDDQESKEDHSGENIENELNGNEQNNQGNDDEKIGNNTNAESKRVMEEPNAKLELAAEPSTKEDTSENNVMETSATEQNTEAMNQENKTGNMNENDQNEVLEREERSEKNKSKMGISEKREVSNIEQLKTDENSKEIDNGKSSEQVINTITEDITDAKSKDGMFFYCSSKVSFTQTGLLFFFFFFSNFLYVFDCEVNL